MISILNYGMGNIRSIQNALNFIKVENKLIYKPEQIINSKKIIIPGVGSFRKAIENIKKRKLLKSLNKVALDTRIPILGICLGMQLMAEKSEEDGSTDGFGWIEGTLKKFSAKKRDVKIPHVGFNEVIFERKNSPIYKNLLEKADFYYVHSYRISYNECNCVSGWSIYGEKFVASIEKDNLFGTQFHPEKSQSNGLLVLKNFADLG